jgi:hypothetical protein
MLLEFITTLTEGIRTPHPEDFILNGSQAASDAIDGMLSAVSNPNLTVARLSYLVADLQTVSLP